jgi:hypothetical protein
VVGGVSEGGKLCKGKIKVFPAVFTALGGCQTRSPRAARSVIVAGAGDIGEVVKCNRIAIIVIVQHIIIIDFDICIIIKFDVIIENQIIILFDDDLLRDLFVGFAGDKATARLGGVEIDNLTGVGADDWLAVQVVEPFAGRGTDAFDAPFLFGHETPFKEVFGIAGCGPLP